SGVHRDPGVPQRGANHGAEEGLLPRGRRGAPPEAPAAEAGRLHQPGGGEEGELVVRERRSAVRLTRGADPARATGWAPCRSASPTGSHRRRGCADGQRETRTPTSFDTGS